MSMTNKYLACMFALLGFGLTDLFYLNYKVIPIIWPSKAVMAEHGSDPLSEFKSQYQAPAVEAGQTILSSLSQNRNSPVKEMPDQKGSSKFGTDEERTRRNEDSRRNRVAGEKQIITGQLEDIKPEIPGNAAESPPPRKFEKYPLLLKEVTVLFDSGQYELNPKARRKLLSKLKGLSLNGTIRVIIDGHSDTTGAGKFDNKQLSLMRAEFVADFMQQQGVPETHLKIRGHGDSQPVDKRHLPIAFEKNRRAEIKIFKDEP